MDILSFILGLQKGKSMGGGSSADVRYVTFVGADGTVLYKKPVAVGDDCVDVAAKGLISTPTKEMDVAATYTYSGWSLTEGGAASSSALKSVTEDRTVYAAFTANVRYYTITYYDSDGTTVLKTATLAYGSNANYTPEKDGSSFVGWTPEIVTVVGDASYTATWEEKTTFEGGSWSDIAEICENGEAANYFKVGDTKTVQEGDNTFVFHIIGLNTDDKSDGSGKAGITVAITGIDRVPIHQRAYGGGTWYRTYSDGTSYECDLRKWLRETFYPTLPTTLQSVIKSVSKKTKYTNSDANSYETRESTDTLFIPSLPEWMNGDATYESGISYPYFDTMENCKFYDTSGAVTAVWIRANARSGKPYRILGQNYIETAATETWGVLPCFCI